MLDREQEEELKQEFNRWPQRMEQWCAHLQSTLFCEEGTRTWLDIYNTLTDRKGGFLVWGWTSKNLRVYVCRSSECKALVTAKYGVWQPERQHQHARDELARFLLGHPSKKECGPVEEC